MVVLREVNSRGESGPIEPCGRDVCGWLHAAVMMGGSRGGRCWASMVSVTGGPSGVWPSE